MDMLIAVAITLVTVCICATTIYLIVTLNELRRLIKHSRVAIDSINQRLEKIEDIFDLLAGIIRRSLSVVNFGSRNAFANLHLLFTAFKFVRKIFRRKKNK